MARADHHSIAKQLEFSVKATGLRAKRGLQNLAEGLPACRQADFDLDGLPYVESKTALWTDESQAEMSLQIGKVQNLRIALRTLDGVLIPAGQTFSFWKQLGNPTKRKGYGWGRELREGCIIPAIGGGLCQLSNALYDVALQAGAEIIERHRHSQVIPGSMAAVDRDATVAWNYVDLRFRLPFEARLRAWMMADHLVVRIYAQGLIAIAPKSSRIPLTVIGNPSAPQSCLSCGVEDCNRHQSAEHLVNAGTRPQAKSSAFLLDASWPEFQTWVEGAITDGDMIFTPFPESRASARYRWPVAKGMVEHAQLVAAFRGYQARRKGSPPVKRDRLIKATDRLARAYAGRIPIGAAALVCDLSLLAELHRLGVLGGREVTVLMTRAPLKLIHERLDEAAARRPGEWTLQDFRADPQRVQAEWIALQRAHRVVTPHQLVASWLKGHGIAVEMLEWNLPPTKERATRRDYLYFPGPTVAREGAHAVKEVALRLGLPVSVGGSQLSGPNFWDGVQVLSPAEAPLESAFAVVHPAVLKDRPTACLAALACGVPVIASPGCGVSSVIEVEFGDPDAIIDAVEHVRKPFVSEPRRSLI